MKPQNGNGENWNAENGANAAFSQDWFGSDGSSEFDGLQTPRIVGRLPNLFGDAQVDVAPRTAKNRGRGAKTAAVVLVSFGLGAAASFGATSFLSGTAVSPSASPQIEASAPELVANDRDFAADSLSEITASTLRSVPENAGGAFGGVEFAANGADLGLAAPRSGRVFSQYANEYNENADFSGFGSAASASAPSNESVWADEIVRPNDAVSPSAPNGSAWGSGNDFERRPTKVADAPASVVATRDNFPTWEDLEANAARRRLAANAVAGNVPETNVPAANASAANAWAASAPASGDALGSSRAVDADYNGRPATNFAASAPNVASDSRVSDYNSGNGIGGFADFTQNVASNAPDVASAPVVVSRPQSYVAQVPAETETPFAPEVGVPSTSNLSGRAAAPVRNLRW